MECENIMRLYVDIETDTYGNADQLRILNISEEALNFAEELGGDISQGLTRMAAREGRSLTPVVPVRYDWDLFNEDQLTSAQEVAIDLLTYSGYAPTDTDDKGEPVEDSAQSALMDLFLRLPLVEDRVSHMLHVARSVRALEEAMVPKMKKTF